MATLTIKKPDGSEAGTLELNDSVFAIEPNLNCVRAAVNQYMAGQRSGTHSVKTRAFVRGGGRKPWKQKGTGRARQGSIRSPQWRGGAIIFGPQPRDYSFVINRKVKANALCSVWSDLIAEGRVVAVENFGIEKPKTSRMVEIFDTLGLDGTVLLVSPNSDPTLLLSVRNLPWVTPVNVENLNVYDLLTHDWVVVTPDVLKRVEETYA